MVEQCNICIEKFTKQTRKKIICNYCKFESCMSCVKHHFKTSEKDPSCMNCFEKFTEDFLYDNFPKAYINKDIKEFKQNLLFEAEKQLLPATQEQAKYDTYIKELEGDVDIEEQRAMEIIEKYNALCKEMNKKKKLISNWYQNYTIPTDTDEVSDVKEKRVFIKQCPSNECNGYLSTRWKCDMCNINVCKECLEIKQEDHVCDANNVASAKEILKNTKPCPSCGTSIYKIYGCSQMWCTHCKTAFDWSSGKIVTSHIHNPHYYEWRRQNGNTQREIGDVVCGGIPDFNILHRQFYDKYDTKNIQLNTFIKDIYSFHRIIEHVHNFELPRLNTGDINNVDIRIKYLNKQITLEKYKQTLLLREKKNRNKRNIQLIFVTFRDAGSDILQRLITKLHRNTNSTRAGSIEPIITPFIIEMDTLVDFINNAFHDLSKKFNFATKTITKVTQKKCIAERYPGYTVAYYIESYKAK